jgi:hypothetical protein
LTFNSARSLALSGADELRRERPVVGHLDPDLVRPLDHVVVRQNVAVRRDDDAGAERALLRGRLTRPALFTLAELVAEEPPQQVLGILAVELRRGTPLPYPGCEW